MPLRKYRYQPENENGAQILPRLAGDHDRYTASPVHAMHEELCVFAESPPQRDSGFYPGWIRLTIPLLASGLLWGMIFAALSYVR